MPGALALDWRSGGRIVTTTNEHPGGLGPLVRAAREGRGRRSSSMPARMATTPDRLPPSTPRSRRARGWSSLSHVLWTTGAVMPVAAIAELAHARGAMVIVDGAQAAGAIPFRFDDLGADLYAMPGPKVAPRSGGDGRAGGRSVGARSTPCRRWPAGSASNAATAPGTPVWWPDARRFEVVELPSPLDRRHGPLARLAVDVRRARVRLPNRDGAGRERWPAAWPRSTA